MAGIGNNILLKLNFAQIKAWELDPYSTMVTESFQFYFIKHKGIC